MFLKNYRMIIMHAASSSRTHLFESELYGLVFPVVQGVHEINNGLEHTDGGTISNCK